MMEGGIEEGREKEEGMLFDYAKKVFWTNFNRKQINHVLLEYSEI